MLERPYTLNIVITHLRMQGTQTSVLNIHFLIPSAEMPKK